ncbi:nicotinate dehydrogenase subunit B [Arboricoccus pini]|uniref:Nicotinate dehydrogenase subunit B n=1 Tax=Arboricoccus pini TaxID=1963835 RepID=A0A212RJ24_9PROT|nr:molybdopterin cofactor-binding domain-containing protein [Arboricoccus pini]SNB72413.1 nicotinate dehydrogenase subunit B [Arboricoccus pini]
MDEARLTRASLLAESSLLAVVGADCSDPPNLADQATSLFLTVHGDGSVQAFNGHVDLGTGIRTALAQIVAEELDVAFERVSMILGHGGLGPDQGATIASETIQITALPLRRAAAQARRYLLELAAVELKVAPENLHVNDGTVSCDDGSNRFVGYGELLGNRHHLLRLTDDVALKPVEQHRVIGRSQPRVDIPAKATGSFTYVHDMRLPGMLHGRVVRPPYAGIDAGDFVGRSLIAIDEGSIAHVPGIVKLVRIGDFIGIVAEREEQAAEAAAALQVTWKPVPSLPDMDDLAGTLRANPSTPRLLEDKGDTPKALAEAARRHRRTYLWPYHLHGSIGPSCSLADWQPGGLRVWSGTQNPQVLRRDLATLMGLHEGQVEILRLEAAGCFGRNCADDVGADAALLSRAVGRPVRVQLTREQEHAWEPKGAAQLMEVEGGQDAEGGVTAYDFSVYYPSNGAPLLAAILTGAVSSTPTVLQMGDRTAIPPYDYANRHIVCHDMPPIVRAAWLRGVSSLPNSFAHESFIDEMAFEAGVDPIEYRLRYLHDPRAIDLVKATAERAGWTPRTSWGSAGSEGDILRGRGFAYALYVHSKFPGYGAAWSAWVADVEVNRKTGEVAVTKVTVGQDSGQMINPAGVKQQIHGNVVQSIGRVMKEEVSFTEKAVATKDWGDYPIITFPELPLVNVLMVDRQSEPPLGVGESAAVPSAAAIANAIYDATGVRFREVPFTPERIRKGLGIPEPLPAPSAEPARGRRSRGRLLGYAVAAAAAGIGLLSNFTPWRSAIEPVARPLPGVYSDATIERGRQLAAIGDCAVCHTADGGLPLAGGRRLETPFGTIVTTNITPDPDHGIGNWSYPAFVRAMREGIHRDGRHLYPAFPYGAYAKTSDADLSALYAFLMAQEPVAASPPETRLAFPFSLRPLLAGWNALFHDAATFKSNPEKSALWNRGAYLVEGLGHCSACHSPRNRLGAEVKGPDHLSGGTVEGWDAPALTALSLAPVPWTEAELFTYLRTGFSPLHGPAAGPMAPVIASLRDVSDDDLRAMAHYLADLRATRTSEAEAAEQAASLEARASTSMPPSLSQGARIYEGACAVCHAADGPTLWGSRPSLALNSNLQAARPDNLLRVILGGIDTPAYAELGYMPSFAAAFDDEQVAQLLSYLRSRFAPDQPAWTDLARRAGEVREILRHERLTRADGGS